MEIEKLLKALYAHKEFGERDGGETKLQIIKSPAKTQDMTRTLIESFANVFNITNIHINEDTKTIKIQHNNQTYQYPVQRNKDIAEIAEELITYPEKSAEEKNKILSKIEEGQLFSLSFYLMENYPINKIETVLNILAVEKFHGKDNEESEEKNRIRTLGIILCEQGAKSIYPFLKHRRKIKIKGSEKEDALISAKEIEELLNSIDTAKTFKDIINIFGEKNLQIGYIVNISKKNISFRLIKDNKAEKSACLSNVLGNSHRLRYYMKYEDFIPVLQKYGHEIYFSITDKSYKKVKNKRKISDIII
jgi:hypothetical protein